MTFELDTGQFKTYCKLNNIDISSFSTDELKTLYQYKLNQLEELLGFNITPTKHTDYHLMFHGPTLLLDFYPVLSIDKIMFDGSIIDLDYKIDNDDGIIYINTPLAGDLEVEYTAGFTDEQYTHVILPLLYDFICYNIHVAGNNSNEISSIKEGEVTVNYDTNNTWYTKINNRINNLRHSYHCRCTML